MGDDAWLLESRVPPAGSVDNPLERLSPVSEINNVLFTTNETGDLYILLQNFGSLCWNEVFDNKILI